MFAAVVTGNRGASAPLNPVEGISWLDTSGDPVEVMKVYRTAGWRSILEYNNTTGAITLYRNINGTALASAFALTLLDDADASTALSTLGVSAYAKTLLDDANASTVLSTLGVSAFAKTILDDADAAAARTTLEISFANIVTTGSIIGAKLLPVVAGTAQTLAEWAGSRTSTSTDYSKKLSYLVGRNGVLTIGQTIGTGGVGTVTSRIYVNGSYVAGTERSTTTSSGGGGQTFANNITVVEGNTVEIWIKTSNAGFSVSLMAFDAKCADPYYGAVTTY